MAVTLVLQNIKIPLSLSGKRDYDREALSSARKKLAACGIRPLSLTVAKRSVDARKKNAVVYLYSVAATVEGAPSADTLVKLSAVMLEKAAYQPALGEETLAARPVIVGFGPAGMFSALALAERGFRPLVLERGASIAERERDVQRFVDNGVLDTESNIQFGAGGAGTFSDGKLVTRKNDPLCAYVLERLVEFGAPRDILTNAKPHIGTDILKKVVGAIADRILSLGGEILYRTRVKEILPRYRGVVLKTDRGDFPSGACILAIGHSARDTYTHLYETGHTLLPKAFSVGVRCEHLAADIDEAMYGQFAPLLPHAEYTLSHREGERGVYSFCMCPGGEVVAAASERETVVTNGMSYRARDGKNDNAALCLSVLPEDYGNDPMRAIAYQRRLESAAYRLAMRAGGEAYSAPFTTVGDLLSGKSGSPYTKVTPSYRGGKVVPCDFKELFSAPQLSLLATGLRRFGRTVRGFDASFATLTGVETRTSAPLRILRGESGESVSMPYLYPCGEGAGYAGGITSAALDGLRIAAFVIGRFRPIESMESDKANEQ